MQEEDLKHVNKNRYSDLLPSSMLSRALPHRLRSRLPLSSLLTCSFSSTPTATPRDYNRWSMVPPAIVAEMSIGAIYASAMWHLPLSTLDGVVCSSPSDFTLSQLIPMLSAAAGGLGVYSTPLGTWIDKVGPVKAGSTGSLLWFTGLMTCAAGAHLHSLPLIYLGYGGIGGAAWALLYLTPVSVTMKWFPDKRGLATGMTLSAFGLGAAVAPFFIEGFVDQFFIAPTFLGDAATTLLSTLPDGTQVLQSSPSTAVVVATAADAAKVGHGLIPGVYACGTGDAGATGAFAALACMYGSAGLVSSQFMKKPEDGWRPEGYEPDMMSTANADIGVPASIAVRTPQFPLLWMTVFGNAVGGLALISSR